MLRRGGGVRGGRADEPAAAARSALARVKNVAARVGPGPVSEVVAKGPYKLRVEVAPNRAALPNTFSVAITRDGQPVPGAAGDEPVRHARHGDGRAELPAPRARPGVFVKSAPALVMVGHWAIQFEVTTPGARPFVVTLLDKASG